MCSDMSRTCLVFVMASVLCLDLVHGLSMNGNDRLMSKRYAMMDLALSQIYDICDTNGDRMLTYTELRCVQEVGNSILGKRRK